MVKNSYGIILIRLGARGPETLLVKGRYSYEFSGFVLGHYSPKNERALLELFRGMSFEERLDVFSLDFSKMWQRVWLTVMHKDLYEAKFSKFHATWIKTDGGTQLRHLIASCGSDWAPRWDFPKGKQNSPKEFKLDCAVREFEEETGLKKDDYFLIPKYFCQAVCEDKRFVYLTTLYVAIETRPLNPQINLWNNHQVAEVSDIGWFSLEKIREVDNCGRLEETVTPIFNDLNLFVQGMPRLRQHEVRKKFPIEQTMQHTRWQQQVIRRMFGRIDEAIQNLPPEIREKIYKEFVKIKLKERKEMGWKEVHDDIEEAPFCEKRLSITNILFCFKCEGCYRNGQCEVCRKNGEFHNLGYPLYSMEDYNEIFIKAY